MKRLIVFFSLCTVLSVCAFAVLLAADRQLDVPLPFSIPLSFTIVSILAPAAFAAANAVQMRRPVIVAATPPPRPQKPAIEHAGGRTAEGVVLLDFSAARRLKDRAA